MEPVFRFGEIIDLEQILAYDHTVKEERLVLKLENKEIILSEIDGVTVGYLRLEYLWSKYPYIGLIIVRREHQKQGVGKGLLTFCGCQVKMDTFC